MHMLVHEACDTCKYKGTHTQTHRHRHRHTHTHTCAHKGCGVPFILTLLHTHAPPLSHPVSPLIPLNSLRKVLNRRPPIVQPRVRDPSVEVTEGTSVVDLRALLEVRNAHLIVVEGGVGEAADEVGDVEGAGIGGDGVGDGLSELFYGGVMVVRLIVLERLGDDWGAGLGGGEVEGGLEGDY